MISLQILDDNNRCKVEALLDAINFCILKRVDIINMSLGVTVLPREKLLKLEMICSKANQAGIIMFAAHHNDEGKISYPASFSSVIGIKAKIEMKKFFEVDLENKNIFFSDSLVFVPQKEHQICKGNSYLTSFVVGAYCSYEEMQINNISQKKILSIDIFRLFQTDIVKMIFFDKIYDRDILNGKNVLFYTDLMETNNLNILNMYKKVCSIRKYQDKEDAVAFQKVIKDYDYFFIGLLSMEFVYEKKEYIKKLVEIALAKKKTVITVFPILNVKERIDLINKYGIEIKSIYK